MLSTHLLLQEPSKSYTFPPLQRHKNHVLRDWYDFNHQSTNSLQESCSELDSDLHRDQKESVFVCQLRRTTGVYSLTDLTVDPNVLPALNFGSGTFLDFNPGYALDSNLGPLILTLVPSPILIPKLALDSAFGLTINLNTAIGHGSNMYEAKANAKPISKFPRIFS
ncbi:hypothetical protein EVAR_67259_1 [Eumeta japonica]|uniref:Uncharacterized protein n=1 Tax=Eumeta variegata TaxID=151549 RepID=A0A4C1SSR2_EUMVA|nr:hypothetical protein EVAR_67259_1 [Eumeta japonica]